MPAKPRIPFRGKGRATSYTDFYKQTDTSSDTEDKAKSRYINLDAEKENDAVDADVRKEALRRRLRTAKEAKGVK